MAIVNRVPDLAAAKFDGKENINVKRISDETGISYSVAYRWIHGNVERIDLPVLEAWCKYFDVSLCEVLRHEAD